MLGEERTGDIKGSICASERKFSILFSKAQVKIFLEFTEYKSTSLKQMLKM